jgi:uncharacterized membrane protein YdjX (TVP38/TMEM64 family)
LIVGLGVLYVAWPAFQTFVHEGYTVVASGEQERVERWVEQFGAWGVIVIIGLMLMQAILAFIPSLVIMVVAVLSYGPVLGGLLAWGGLLLAASLAYTLGRLLHPLTIEQLVGDKTEKKMEHFIDRYGLWAIVTARISPVLSTDAVSYAAGLVDMSYGPFILATGAGTVPLTVVVAYLGAEADQLGSSLIWVSAVSIALFLGYVAYDQWQQRAS